MERNALSYILKWKESKDRKPLIVWGARQVGKTYLIKDIFAETYYKDNFLYIDLSKEDDYRNYISSTCNAEKIIRFIEAKEEKKIDSNTLLIFDEIQESPNIISALKYFCQDYREIPVIITGSMVRTKLRRDVRKEGKSILFPVGKINELTLYPLTFDEFLLNSNNILYETVKNAYFDSKALDEGIHELVLNYFYNYLLIGGMPEAVDNFIKTNDLLSTREIIKVLYSNYLNDMSLYQISDESLLRTREIYNNIYKELNKESKNFSPSLIKEKLKNRDLFAPIEWLKLAHVVHQSSQLKEHVTTPLYKENESNFRLYLGDMGLFTYQSGINASTFISDKKNTLSGIFFENYVADELMAKGINLFYWRGKRSNELEFIVQSNQDLIPIDVKKGKASLNSLEEFSHHNNYSFAIKISKNKYGYFKENKLLTIPFYFVPFIADDLSKGNEINLIKM